METSSECERVGEKEEARQASMDSMSDLEQGMLTVIRVFHKYSGQKCKLKKAELKALINNEMNNFIKKIHENETLDELFADLDQNGDLEIDFKEFIALIAMVTSACEELFTPDYHND
ncbi:protein S100-B-like [Antennarius striatus]|uniref:protein S100-B-like n=1 Tax=Antennarius striatus TaxID=241820 RepID=UPI0035B1249D